MHQSLLRFPAALLPAALLSVALLAAPACTSGNSDDDADPPPTDATTTTSEPTTTTTSTDDAVRAAYDSFVTMIDRIRSTSVDPNDAELTMRMVDPALSEVRTRLSTWQAQGQVWVLGDLARHDVESVVVARDGTSAVVTDCVVGNDALVPVGSVDPSLPSPQTQRGTVTLVNQGGTWFVSNVESGEHWEGVAGCAD